MSDRPIRQGDLYWIAPDLTRKDAVAHPHLVVQDDVFNASRVHSVIVVALTSNLHRADEPGNVRLDAGEGGLTKPSVVVVSQVDAVERGRLGAYIGSLSARRVEQCLDGLRFQQAAFFVDR